LKSLIQSTSPAACPIRIYLNTVESFGKLKMGRGIKGILLSMHPDDALVEHMRGLTEGVKIDLDARLEPGDD